MDISSLTPVRSYELYNQKKSNAQISAQKDIEQSTTPTQISENQNISKVSEYIPNEQQTGETLVIANPYITKADIETDRKNKSENSKENDKTTGDKSGSEKNATDELSDDEKKTLDELKSRDAEVKSHEQAHISAGGAYVRGGASYSTQKGPDGKEYAIGGEVSIDTSPVKDDPAATLRKAQVIQAAAMAPAAPSGQDRAVAAAAMKMAMNAMSELAEKNKAKISGSDESDSKTDATKTTGTNKNENSNENKSDKKVDNKKSTNPYAAANSVYNEQSKGSLADLVA